MPASTPPPPTPPPPSPPPSSRSIQTPPLFLIERGAGNWKGRGGHRMAADYVSAWMTDELRALRDVARQFFEREAAPQMAKWSEQRFVDREFWEGGQDRPALPDGPGGVRRPRW